MSKIYSFLLLAAFCMGAISCGKGGSAESAKNDLTSRIPASAMAAMVIDVGKIYPKLNFDALKKSEGYQRFVKKASDNEGENGATFKAVLEDPSLSGFDLKGKMVGYWEAENIMEGEFVFLFMVPLSDSKKWEDFAGKMGNRSEKIEIISKPDYKHLPVKGDGFIGWNNEVLVVLSGKYPISTENGELRPEYLAKVMDAFKPKGEKLLQNATFKKYVDSGKDMIAWMSTDLIFERILKGSDGDNFKGLLGMLGIPEKALKGNSIGAYHDFQNGKIESAINYEFSKELREKFGKVFRDKPTKDYSKYLPAADLMAVYSAALDLNETYKVLSSMRLTKRFDYKLEEMGTNSEAVLGALSGEGMIGAYRAKGSTETDLLFVSGVGNKANIEQLLQATSALKIVEVNGNRITANLPPDQQVFGAFNDEILVLSTRQEWVEPVMAGGFGAQAAKHETITAIQQGWAGIAVTGFDFLADVSMFGHRHYKMDENGEMVLKTDTGREETLAMLARELKGFYTVAKSYESVASLQFTNTSRSSVEQMWQMLDETYKYRVAAAKRDTTLQ